MWHQRSFPVEADNNTVLTLASFYLDYLAASFHVIDVGESFQN